MKLRDWTQQIAWRTINHRKSCCSHHWIKENREIHRNQKKNNDARTHAQTPTHTWKSGFFVIVLSSLKGTTKPLTIRVILELYKRYVFFLRSLFFHLLLPVWCSKGALQTCFIPHLLVFLMYSTHKWIQQWRNLNSQKVKMLPTPLPYNYASISNKSVLPHRGQSTKLHHTHL